MKHMHEDLLPNMHLPPLTQVVLQQSNTPTKCNMDANNAGLKAAQSLTLRKHWI